MPTVRAFHDRHMMRCAVALASAAVLVLSAHAQETGATAAASPPDESVVITGERPKDDLRSDVSDFVAAHAKGTQKIDQLARWHDPVCPSVRGLAPALNAFIVDRIKTVARDVGAPQRDDCSSNIEVLFTHEPKALVAEIAKSKPRLLGYHFLHQRRSAADNLRPIRAWHVTATGNGGTSIIDSPYERTPGGIAGSRLSQGLRSELIHTLVVVNIADVEGRPIGAVSDYIARLVLAQTDDPDACGALASIFDYMSPDCGEGGRPEALTSSDMAFLRSLYALNADSIGSLQRGNLKNQMVSSLEKPD